MSKWLLEGPVLENLLKDIVTDSIEKNSKFQYDSGMKPKVVRRSSGNCCEWCDKIAGTYYYPDVPRDVYRRHNNCNCTVEYYPGDGKKQNVWSEKWSEDKEVLEKRKKVGLENTNKNSIIKVYRSLSAAAKRYNVRLAESRQYAKLAEGQTIKGKAFAGLGTNKEIRDRFRLESQYHIDADKWKKVSGKGYVIVEGKPKFAELHWYEAEGEVYELKVKRYLDEG